MKGLVIRIGNNTVLGNLTIITPRQNRQHGHPPAREHPHQERDQRLRGLHVGAVHRVRRRVFPALAVRFEVQSAAERDFLDRDPRGEHPRELARLHHDFADNYRRENVRAVGAGEEFGGG